MLSVGARFVTVTAIDSTGETAPSWSCAKKARVHGPT